jgi:hypothetical protein
MASGPLHLLAPVNHDGGRPQQATSKRVITSIVTQFNTCYHTLDVLELSVKSGAIPTRSMYHFIIQY